jgi:hypothetical protein
MTNEQKKRKTRKTHMDDIDGRARKNGIGMTELRKSADDRRDLRSWIDAVPTL